MDICSPDYNSCSCLIPSSLLVDIDFGLAEEDVSVVGFVWLFSQTQLEQFKCMKMIEDVDGDSGTLN